jgi:hypothetical protein
MRLLITTISDRNLFRSDIYLTIIVKMLVETHVGHINCPLECVHTFSRTTGMKFHENRFCWSPAAIFVETDVTKNYLRI